MKIMMELAGDEHYVTAMTIADAMVHCSPIKENPDMMEAIANHLLTEATRVRAGAFKESMRGVKCASDD